MSVQGQLPEDVANRELCDGCRGNKSAPLAIKVFIGEDLDAIYLCEECGRDTANVIGFFCVRNGGWSKLEPKKKKSK